MGFVHDLASQKLEAQAKSTQHSEMKRSSFFMGYDGDKFTLKSQVDFDYKANRLATKNQSHVMGTGRNGWNYLLTIFF